jgi:hypothetical protein
MFGRFRCDDASRSALKVNAVLAFYTLPQISGMADVKPDREAYHHRR